MMDLRNPIGRALALWVPQVAASYVSWNRWHCMEQALEYSNRDLLSSESKLPPCQTQGHIAACVVTMDHKELLCSSSLIKALVRCGAFGNTGIDGEWWREMHGLSSALVVQFYRSGCSGRVAPT